MRLLLDEMYPAALAAALEEQGVQAATVVQLGLAGSSDPDVWAAALGQDRVLLTENVGDFARIAAEHLTAGRHHPGLLIALSTRFSRRPAGRAALLAAIAPLAGEPLQHRVVYLQAPPRR